MSAPIGITAVGRRAAHEISRAHRARVVGVFASSFHLETDRGALVCIGHPRIGHGPINGLAAWQDDIAECRDLGVCTGQAAAITGTRIEISGGPVLQLDAARVWQAPAWPPAVSRRAQGVMCGRIATLVQETAPEDCLARLLFNEEPRDGLARAFFRRAAVLVAALLDWHDASCADEQSMDARAELAVSGLVGLGPGLTPSGDDFLCGMLVALLAAGETRAAAELGRWIKRTSADATTPLSRAFLAAACAGEANEALHALIAGVLSADVGLLDRGLVLLARSGHTSGWDMLAGAMAVLSCPKPPLRVRMRG